MVYIWEHYAKEEEKRKKGISKTKDFQYYLVPIRKYSNEELLANGDEMSLLMLINKVQTREDVEALRHLPPRRLEEILKDTPPHVLKIIADVMLVLLLKENVPMDEAAELVGKIEEKKMGELFENMEKMDIQEERRNTAEQRERAEKAEARADREKEKGIRLYLDTCRRFGVPGEEMQQTLTELYEMSPQEAQEWAAKM